MAEFLELVPGVPLTQEMRQKLADNPHYMETPLWKVDDLKTKRAVRTARGKDVLTNDMFVKAYFANAAAPEG